MAGSYVNANYVTGGADKVDWYGELQDEINQEVNAGISQQWAIANAMAAFLQAHGNNQYTAWDIFNGLYVNNLQGGNFEFSVASDISNALQTIGCDQDRCGSIPSLDFSHGLPSTYSEVHLDTANPLWGFGLGAIIHGAVDLVGGNTVLAGGIPR